MLKFIWILFISSSLFAVEGIDLVYTWVDGADTEWAEIRDEYLQKVTGLINRDASSKNKYRNRDELKYSLRSVMMYAPWFHHIYIVTNGQVPQWFKQHPKISVVTHAQIFKNPNYLPTFSSIAIEANLHRIPGLLEKYIYFNDDVFLAAPVTPNDFYSSDGQPIYKFRKKHYTPRGIAEKGELASLSAWRNTNLLLDMLFSFSERYPLAHGPYPFTKSQARAVEMNFPGIMEVNSSQKFRHPSAIALINGFMQYFAIYKGEAIEGDLKTEICILRDNEKSAKRMLVSLQQKPCSVFCLEDGGYEGNLKVDEILKQFLQARFSMPAPWENSTK